MNNKPVEWIDVWGTATLHVLEIKSKDRSIYLLDNPLIDEAISVDGEELVAFAKKLLGSENKR